MAPAKSSGSTTQREQAYAKLRSLLMVQRIREGERLREPDWSKRLEVNRTALREAFARLEAEGLLMAGANGGYFVPTMTSQDMLEVLAIRRSLECCAIESICASSEPVDLTPLDDACDEMAYLIERNLQLGASEVDRRFHERIISLSGNQRLIAIYNRAPLPMLHDRIRQFDQWRGEVDVSLAEHRKIVAALRDADCELALQRLRDHLTGRELMPYLSGDEDRSVDPAGASAKRS